MAELRDLFAAQELIGGGGETRLGIHGRHHLHVAQRDALTQRAFVEALEAQDQETAAGTFSFVTRSATHLEIEMRPAPSAIRYSGDAPSASARPWGNLPR